MSGEGSGGRERPVRLTPPPRIEPVGPRSPRGAWSVGLAVGLVALAVGIGAFIVVSLDDREWILGRDSVGEDVAASSGSAEAVEDEPTPAADAEAVGESLDMAPASADPAPPRPARVIHESTAAKPAPDDGFGREMAAGLAALDAGDWEGARAAFSRAAEIRPGSAEPATGLARVEAAADQAAIEARRARARALIESEAWHQAVAEYEAALEIDPTLSFARDGLRLAEARAALSDRIDFHLGRADRLAAPAVFAEAEDLLDAAREIEPAGPRHADQVARLEGLLDRVREPVRVALVSDALTEVTVYQVGRLGTFSRRELELRPGVYTIVGSRAGYRDVRRQLRVEPGAAPEPFEIRCEEKI